MISTWALSLSTWLINLVRSPGDVLAHKKEKNNTTSNAALTECNSQTQVNLSPFTGNCNTVYKSYWTRAWIYCFYITFSASFAKNRVNAQRLKCVLVCTACAAFPRVNTCHQVKNISTSWQDSSDKTFAGLLPPPPTFYLFAVGHVNTSTANDKETYEVHLNCVYGISVCV